MDYRYMGSIFRGPLTVVIIGYCPTFHLGEQPRVRPSSVQSAGGRPRLDAARGVVQDEQLVAAEARPRADPSNKDVEAAHAGPRDLGFSRTVVSEISGTNRFVSSYCIKWMSGSTKRQCDRALTCDRRAVQAGEAVDADRADHAAVVEPNRRAGAARRVSRNAARRHAQPRRRR